VRSIVVLSAGLLLASATAAAAASDPVPFLEWEVLARHPHDTAAFTQGLVLDERGRLFESTGQYGESTLRELDLASGEVLRASALPDEHFGEGLALVGDDLVQLTWKTGVATRSDASTFALLETYDYDGEGWGLCFDGERLVMSDGSDTLVFRDPDTFEASGSVAITIEGQPLHRLNELECVEGSIWANVWYSDAIVRIDPGSGEVDGLVDLRSLLTPHPADADAGAVLNGIAWDATTGTFLVTGKRWPEVVEIRLVEPEE